MANVPRLDEQIIEQAARVLGNAGSGNDITRIFQAVGLTDYSGESTKWRRIHSVLCNAQRQNGVANKFFEFIQKLRSELFGIVHGKLLLVCIKVSSSGMETGLWVSRWITC